MLAVGDSFRAAGPESAPLSSGAELKSRSRLPALAPPRELR
jgi:hypothetical protein